jgi:hypothetical protein
MYHVHAILMYLFNQIMQGGIPFGLCNGNPSPSIPSFAKGGGTGIHTEGTYFSPTAAQSEIAQWWHPCSGDLRLTVYMHGTINSVGKGGPLMQDGSKKV